MDYWEEKARKYCELKGLDPDQRIMHGADPLPDGSVPAIAIYTPRYKLVEKQLKEFFMMLAVLDVEGFKCTTTSER